MKQQQQTIPEYDLSPQARAGLLIRKIQHPNGENQHVTARPHRDSHYLLLLATQGQFTFNLDFEEVTFSAPALLLIVPGQVHHVINIINQQGWGISFDPSLLDSELQALLQKGFSQHQPVDLQSAFGQQAVALMSLMENLQTGFLNGYTSRAMHALLTALTRVMAGQLTAGTDSAKKKESRPALIEQQFNQLLNQHYKRWKQPAQYAAELTISISHLNDTVKAIAGLSVTAHIRQRVILEAKRLLYVTDHSVKKIGYELGYDEPVYFGKLFKKVTGSTPLQFRQQFRE